MSKLTKSYTFIVILFLVLVFASLIAITGNNISNNNNSNLTTESQGYVNDLTGNDKTMGWNDSIYATDLENPQNGTPVDNKNDFSLDFNFGEKSVNSISGWFYITTSVPKFLIHDVFGLVENDFTWILDIFNWFWRIAIFLAIVFFIRRGE